MAKRQGYKGAIDLSGAQVAEGVTSVRSGPDLTPYEDLLRSSWEAQKDGRGAVIEVVIPSEARTTVESRLRQAGKALSLGVATGERASDQDGKIVLRLQANTKKEITPKGQGKAKSGAASGGLPKVAR